MKKAIKEKLEIIKRGTLEIISEEELFKKLKQSQNNKRPLRIKAGFDPTAPDIHLGHTILLRKLRVFQDMGHKVYFLIGDFTARIGDPSGQDRTRPAMTDSQIKRNALTYKRQVFKILDKAKTKVVFNSHWLAKLSSLDILRLTRFGSVGQLLARQDFKQRFESGKEISLQEFIYPLLQAYDSVYLKADIEIGGGDQKFNLLMGRELQREFKQSPQVVIMLPLLEGLDGIKKMSKSLGNYIGINEKPKEIFGKIMSISDELMPRYYELLTDEDLSYIKSTHPKEAKLKLAQIIVRQYYGENVAEKERSEFERVFSHKALPQDITIYRLTSPIKVIEILQKANLVKSGNEARRLMRQGAVSFNNQKIKEDLLLDKEGILKIGSRRFLKIIQ